MQTLPLLALKADATEVFLCFGGVIIQSLELCDSCVVFNKSKAELWTSADDLSLCKYAVWLKSLINSSEGSKIAGISYKEMSSSSWNNLFPIAVK